MRIDFDITVLEYNKSGDRWEVAEGADQVAREFAERVNRFWARIDPGFRSDTTAVSRAIELVGILGGKLTGTETIRPNRTDTRKQY